MSLAKDPLLQALYHVNTKLPTHSPPVNLLYWSMSKAGKNCQLIVGVHFVIYIPVLNADRPEAWAIVAKSLWRHHVFSGMSTCEK